MSLPRRLVNSASLATPVNDTKKTEPLLPELEDIILEYVSDENFNSHNYSMITVGSTFFEKRLPVYTLLQHVVRGEYAEVNAMLTKNPSLLLEKDTVTDYSDRKHSKRTVYQIALGACDYNLKDVKGHVVVDGMVEMIEKHFLRLPEKTTEEINILMRDQYVGQFPKGFEEKEAKRMASDLKALNTTMDAIKKASDENCRLISSLEDEIRKIIREEKSERADKLSSMTQSVLKATNDDFDTAFHVLTDYVITQQMIKSDVFNVDMLKALYQFRNHLEPKGVITFGKHFNHQLLADAAQCYDDNYVGFGSHWDSPKNRLCWQKMFGYIERFVPACDAQVIAQGLYSVLEDGEKSNRSLKFRYGGGSFFPLGSDVHWEIGYSCAAMPVAGRGAGWGGRAFFSKLMSSKNNSAGAYAASRQSATEELLRDSVVAVMK